MRLVAFTSRMGICSGMTMAEKRKRARMNATRMMRVVIAYLNPRGSEDLGCVGKVTIQAKAGWLGCVGFPESDRGWMGLDDGGLLEFCGRLGRVEGIVEIPLGEVCVGRCSTLENLGNSTKSCVGASGMECLRSDGWMVLTVRAMGAGSGVASVDRTVARVGAG